MRAGLTPNSAMSLSSLGQACIRAVVPAIVCAASFCLPAIAREPVPAADHHQHLFSPAAAAMLSAPGKPFAMIDADRLVALLDEAGIRRATVLSVAYLYGSPSRTLPDEAARVRAENDWTAAQAARHPDRLVAFCAVAPLKDYALEEIDRCARDPRLRRGLKLHVGNGDVQLDDPAHMAKMRAVFAAANRHRMAIVIHLRASISRGRPYGAAQARLFVERLLPQAPDVTVMVAHFAGSGPGYDDPPAQEAMAELAAAVEREDPRARRLVFDVAAIADPAGEGRDAAAIVGLIRRVGLERVYYGSDSAAGDNLPPRAAWQAFRKLPLREEEFARIADNVAPWLR